MKINCTTEEEFLDFLKSKVMGGKIYIYGAGNFGRTFGCFLNQNEIEWHGYLDRNEKIWGTCKEGKRIYALKEVKVSDDMWVIISVSAFGAYYRLDEIIDMLLEYGVDDGNILQLSENRALTGCIALSVRKPEREFEKLRTLKEIYSGRRCFIIGNGPSLTIEDLDKIQGEISFACNWIINLYPRTKWRPTDFCCIDPNFSRAVVELDKFADICSQCDHFFTSYLSKIYDEWRNKAENFYFLKSNDLGYGRFEEDIVRGLCPGGTTLYQAAQIAVYMGVSEIYLLGVDFSFPKTRDRYGQIHEHKDVKNVHAEGMDQTKGIYPVDLILDGWNCLKQYADEKGIHVYNATRGGKLEVFERVDFDSLF